MNGCWVWLILAISITVSAQEPTPTSTQDSDVMLLGVSRNDSMFKGGIGSAKWTGKGTLAVEPVARLTSSGQWNSLPSDGKSTSACNKFAHDYLNKTHTYTVVSADGNGAAVQTSPVALSECYGYDGVGTYSGATIAVSAIAASSPEFFASSGLLQPLDKSAAAPILKALSALIPKKLDSESHLRLFSLKLEGHDLVILQRAFADYASVSEQGRLELIMATGKLDHGRFQILHWKQNTEDEDERILGTIRLKSGPEFLRSEEHTSELQSLRHLVCRLLLDKI